MIEPMEKIYICSLRDQTDAIMKAMMRCGALEPAAAETMVEEEAASSLLPAKRADLSGEEDLLSRLEECIAAVKEFGQKESVFSKGRSVSWQGLTDEGMLPDAAKACGQIEEIITRRKRCQQELRKRELRKTSFLPWEGLDVSFSDFASKSTRIICFILPGRQDLEEIEETAGEKGLLVHGEMLSEDGENRYAAVLVRQKEEEEVRTIFRRLGAKEPELPEERTGTFREAIKKEEARIEKLRKQIRAENEKLRQEAGKREALELAWDAVKLRVDRLSIRGEMLRTEKADIITGWVPASRKETVSKELERYTCSYEYREPERDEDFPVLMKNSRLVAPFSALTEMYSLPNPRSVDSSWAIGLFFFLFFGMMLSDAGYGLILTACGLGGAKLLNLGEGGKRLMTMLGISGISTIIWGIIYGSFFGDAIPAAAQVFFGKSAELPRLIDPLTQPMIVLGLSCGLGALHLFIGMGFQAYLMIKRGNIRGAIFDVGFWYMLLLGLPCLLLSGRLKALGILLSAAGAMGLVLTQGREKPGIFGKLAGGIMSLYDITGYFSDVLSYSRILALGLATGVIASVVNTIGTLAGGGLMGALLFVVIFAAGHGLNLAINALGAYVHAARLQYVEFFGKFYESGGRKFHPLRAKTKYVKVKEEQ